ncbi:hypothetical protein F5Y16DRAFT_397054 [Xylariaceae sp. FL0255]|nr:hypothetical protein F5Y16DRAFT_397054 [Xylariaceae sp. FL0255]
MATTAAAAAAATEKADLVHGTTAIGVCSVCTTALFVTRLGLRKWRGQRLNEGDVWISAAMLFEGIRVISSIYRNTHHQALSMMRLGIFTLSPALKSELYSTGKLTVVKHFAIVALLWCLKMAVLCFLRVLLRKLIHERRLLWGTYSIMGATFLGAFISVFTECTPLSLLWEAVPAGVACQNSKVWITTYEVGNLITDIILFILPFPLIFRARVPLWKRTRLSIIFGFGAFLIAVNLVRLVEGQRTPRNLLVMEVWGALEVLIAALVATLPTIYVLLRPSFKKKSSKRNTSATTAEQRTTSTTSPDGSTKSTKSTANGTNATTASIRQHGQGSSRGGDPSWPIWPEIDEDDLLEDDDDDDNDPAFSFFPKSLIGSQRGESARSLTRWDLPNARRGTASTGLMPMNTGLTPIDTNSNTSPSSNNTQVISISSPQKVVTFTRRSSSLGVGVPQTNAHQGGLSSWLELEETVEPSITEVMEARNTVGSSSGRGNESARPSSPQISDAATGHGILVATEIIQEIWKVTEEPTPELTHPEQAKVHDTPV